MSERVRAEGAAGPVGVDGLHELGAHQLGPCDEVALGVVADVEAFGGAVADA